jgi:GT2 family glycosyltransferase
MQKIYIIIVNYRSEVVIGDAVRSFNEENVEIKTVILDNESTDDSYEALIQAVGDDIEIIRSETNLGYSAGANYTAEYIRKKYSDTEYFFFFNPDATATKNMLGRLHETLKNHKSAAAISPLILDMEGKEWFTGTVINWDNCTINNTPVSDKPNEIREIDTFNGCAVLLDTQIFFEVGMFNEDLFIYYDEPFLSMELLSKGYVSLYDPQAVAHHHVSFITGAESTFTSHLMTRNHVSFFTKYGKSKNPLCPYLRPLRLSLFYLKRLKLDNVKYIFLGILDAIKGKKGI